MTIIFPKGDIAIFVSPFIFLRQDANSLWDIRDPDAKAIAFRHDGTDNGVPRAIVASMNLRWLSANTVGRTC